MRRLLARAQAHAWPLQAMLELTARCNLRCRHCFVARGEGRDELPAGTWERILDQLAEAGVLFLVFTGGEPLVYPHFQRVLLHARNRGFSVVVYSNGTLIDAGQAARLRDLDVERMEISLLGARAATHDRLTGVPGSFDAAVSAIQNLVEAGLRVQVKTTWMRPNIGEARELIELAKALGASFRSGYLLLHHKGTQPLDPDLYLTADDVARMARRSAAGQVDATAAQPVPVNQRHNVRPCGAGHASCYITAQGDLRPCVAIPATAGNVCREPFSALWSTSPAFADLRRIRLSDLPVCASCSLFNRCSRCAGLAAMETGSLLGASPQACMVARTMESVRTARPCEIG
jgi:radical SAM protein with 4Fe4S-binding SPASM domain